MKSNFTEIKIKKKLDNEEKIDCINLLINAFSFVQNKNLNEYFNFFLDNIPQLKYLIIKKNDKIIALQCILDRQISFYGILLNVAGMSYAAIDQNFKNTEVGVVLKKKLFDYINENSDISIGFARKAMDNFWYPFGYRGVTNFSEIKISIPKIINKNLNVKTKNAKNTDIPLLIKWYNQTYKNCIGSFNRNFELWEFYLKKISFEKNDILIFFDNEIEIGYCIFDKNCIIELGYDNKSENILFQILCNKLKYELYDHIIFKIGLNHPLFFKIQKQEHIINKKYVWKGGHIAKITDIYNFITKIQPILEQRLKNSQINNFEFSCNKILFSYINNALKIRENSSNESDIYFENPEWTKLILGASPLKYLNGYIYSPFENILNVLFPTDNLQFPDLDQY